MQRPSAGTSLSRDPTGVRGPGEEDHRDKAAVPSCHMVHTINMTSHG